MPSPQQSILISLLTTTALLLVPFIIFAENTAPHMWANRLYRPLFALEPNRHTPVATQGTYVPPTISATITYTATDNPLLLTGITYIPAGVTVTLAPGVQVVAHEFAALAVDGTLNVAGTAEQPVTFTSNEVHPDNKNWSGLQLNTDGRATINHARIEYASPGITCQVNSSVTANSVETRYGLVGVYTESTACTVANSRLQALHYGIVARGVDPTTTNSLISAGKKDIAVFEN